MDVMFKHKLASLQRV